ncbi:MTH1187 family thiamine-binding protein [bacterium BFN5]|nr:MTH1187 family thiamine-binding protein [bacterium BFN5]QJW44594.1 MTH1187 family thiamine-binding protein [bacterium BFN5]
MAVVEVTVIPLGTGTPSISHYVAQCHKILEQAHDVKHQLTPMSTIIEGDLDRVLEILKKLHEVPFANGAQRVSTTIRIDDRRDKELTMQGKIKAVTEKL